MKKTEKIEAMLNDYCDRIDTANSEGKPWREMFNELMTLCKSAQYLGYKLDYDPIKNRYTVSRGKRS